MYQKAAMTKRWFVLWKGRGWLAFHNQDDIASAAPCCLPGEFALWCDVALAMQRGWGWLLFCIWLTLLIIVEFFLIYSDKKTSNQLSSFTFVCKLKIIVFAFYNSTCPPGDDFLERVLDVVKWSSVNFQPRGWTSWEGKWDFTGHWTTLKVISHVFTQFSLVCAAMLRQTPVSARTDGASRSPRVASVQHISFGHLIVQEREEYIYNSPRGVSYSPLLYRCLCLHGMHFPSCKELSKWQHNNFAFSQHKNSIPLLLERWDVHVRDQNLIPRMQ